MIKEYSFKFKKRFLIFSIFIFLALSFALKIEAISVLFDFNPPDPFVGDSVIIFVTAAGFGAGPSQFFCFDWGNNSWTRHSKVNCDYNNTTNRYDCPTQTYSASYGSPGEYIVRFGIGDALGCGNPYGIQTSKIMVHSRDSPVVSCGNGAIDAGEDCDGSELAGKSCQDFNDSSGKKYESGSLSCYPPDHKNQCRFDTSGCISPSPPPPPPLSTGYDDPLIWDSIIQFILYFTNFIFNICLGLSVLMILIGAFVMVAGGGNPLKREKAKRIIIWALIGFSMALMSRGIFELLKLILGVQQ